MVEILLDILTLILNTFLGLFVFYRNTKSWTNRLFFTITVLIDIYVITNYLSLHPPLNTPSDQLFWIRIVIFVCSFIGPTLVLLVSTFPQDKITMSSKKRIVLSLLCAASAISALSPFLFTAIQYPNGQPVPVAGPLIPIFFIDFVGLFVLSFFLLIYKYRRSMGIIKTQHLYFLLGIIATFSLMAIFTLIFVVVLKFSGLVFLGPISILFLVAFIAYSIDKHRFLDIHLIVARSVAYSLFLLCIGLVYGSGLFLVSVFITRQEMPPITIVISVLFSVVMAFSFQPIQRLLEKLTDKIFFKNRYDSSVLLNRISHILAATLLLDDVVGLTLDELLSKMEIMSGAVLLLHDDTVSWVKQKGEPFTDEAIYDEHIRMIIESVKGKDESILVFDELEESKEKRIMRDHGITIILPLMVENQLIGGLILGNKSSGDIYSLEDINVLKILAPELAIAIKNALSYDEIKRFNVTLEEEVKRATTRLRHANDKLKELDHLKDEFVSIASHELRTPMTAIKSYLWMALYNKSSKPVDPKVKHYLEIAYTSTDELLKLVQDMLTISRIEGKRIELKLETFNLKELLNEIYETLKIKADEKNIDFKISFPAKHIWVNVDRSRIREVFQNLVGNALKFTPEKGKINIDVSVEKGFIQTAISDTGPGIAKEDISKLFQKFGRLDQSYSKLAENNGTGLGLYIAKQIIVLHKGDITVHSEIGKGSTFTFTLPVYSDKGGE